MWIITIIVRIHLIDLPVPEERVSSKESESEERTDYRRQIPGQSPGENEEDTRQWLFRQRERAGDDEKDLDIKTKIATLVSQTVHDTERKVKSIEGVKKKNREHAPYKIGFILSLIKKARDVLNELFNVAVKHRDEWKALEQLKIFELIVHTNVDTTNLVRQLVEIHIQHMNSTGSVSEKKRIVLL